MADRNLDIDAIKAKVERPEKVVVTGGMPYANGPIHLGHLAGALVPPDIFARWMGMLIGRENVLFVCGTDEHGSTSELAASNSGRPIREFIDEIHDRQYKTFERYQIKPDVYSGTSRPECFPIHQGIAQEFLRKMYRNGVLEKKASRQWFDPKLQRFLQDRFVTGKCPNPKCENDSAYSDECDVCGGHHEPDALQNPRSAFSDATPELRETLHLWLNMWEVSEELRHWIQSKEKKWRNGIYNEVINTVLPGLRFSNAFEENYKALKADLPKHKSKYAAGKKIALTFDDKKTLVEAKSFLEDKGIPCEFLDSWAHRAITRDVTWGIPLPEDLGAELKGKSLYVWPDSLVAPIAFTKIALQNRGRNPDESDAYWKNPKARICQFIGQDNVFFYVLMQGAMWFGSQAEIHRMPEAGEYQLSDVFSNFHLMVEGEKMSKSRGNFVLADELIDGKGFTADQVRYFLALLSLSEKGSNFDFNVLHERNKFLAGPMNAAFEKPISACHSKFGGKVPSGKLNEKIVGETAQILQKYFKSMEKAEYSTLLYAIENYARAINSMFTQFKPHDDRQPEESRKDALYTCFFVLKNLMIMLYPFVPSTMDRLRRSLNLPENVWTIDQLGTPIQAGHDIGEKMEYFPAVE